jgi:hypothetical protein
MSSVQPLLDAAGRRRSPATTPGFHAGIGPLTTRASATPPTHQPSMRSWPSCAKPATIATADASAR